MVVVALAVDGFPSGGNFVKALVCRQALVMAMLLLASSSSMAQWSSWWSTPEQQALRAYEDGNPEALLQLAPDSEWQALGQFQSGDYAAASEKFAERAQTLRSNGLLEDANRALYNQGVSDVLSGQLEQAIERFDEVLAQDPDFVDAEHNLEIARQLLELQQRQESKQEQGSQNQSDNQEQSEPSGESRSEEENSRQNGDQQNSPDSGADTQAQQQASDQPPGSSRDNNASADSSNGNGGDELDGNSDAQEQQDAIDAREALDAEAQQQAQAEARAQERDERGVPLPSERRLSEAEQAAEQLLRRIPDDPAGLLRRKLEQSHRNEYPEVRNGSEPW